MSQIADVVVPLGCNQRSATVTPRNALQATYAKGHDYAAALLLEFADADAARAFASARRTDLMACRDQPDDPFSGAAAPVESVTGTPERLRARYRSVDDPDLLWRSAQWVDGARVLVVEASAPVDLTRWPSSG